MSESVPKSVLDATSSGKHMWHDQMKDAARVVHSDMRFLEPGVNEHRMNWSCEPDVLADTRQLPYRDAVFDLIAYDPPHRIKEGGMSALSGVIETKYGALRAETWQSDISRSFNELWRTLRPGGVITFKWADVHKDHDEVLGQIDKTPLYGTTTQKGENKVKWWVFHKAHESG